MCGGLLSGCGTHMMLPLGAPKQRLALTAGAGLIGIMAGFQWGVARAEEFIDDTQRREAERERRRLFVRPPSPPHQPRPTPLVLIFPCVRCVQRQGSR